MTDSAYTPVCTPWYVLAALLLAIPLACAAPRAEAEVSPIDFPEHPPCDPAAPLRVSVWCVWT